PRLFQPGLSQVTRHADNGGLNLMYHGGLYHRCGLDLAIRAVDQLRGQIPGLKFRIYGDGEAVPELEELIKQLDLAEHVELGCFVPIDKIPALITWADLGVVPNRLNPFTDLQFPTKAFEYISMGVPVIIARTTAVEETFGD